MHSINLSALVLLASTSSSVVLGELFFNVPMGLDHNAVKAAFLEHGIKGYDPAVAPNTNGLVASQENQPRIAAMEPAILANSHGATEMQGPPPPPGRPVAVPLAPGRGPNNIGVQHMQPVTKGNVVMNSPVAAPLAPVGQQHQTVVGNGVMTSTVVVMSTSKVATAASAAAAAATGIPVAGVKSVAVKGGDKPAGGPASGASASGASASGASASDAAEMSDTEEVVEEEDVDEDVPGGGAPAPAAGSAAGSAVGSARAPVKSAPAPVPNAVGAPVAATNVPVAATSVPVPATNVPAPATTAPAVPSVPAMAAIVGGVSVAQPAAATAAPALSPAAAATATATAMVSASPVAPVIPVSSGSAAAPASAVASSPSTQLKSFTDATTTPDPAPESNSATELFSTFSSSSSSSSSGGVKLKPLMFANHAAMTAFKPDDLDKFTFPSAQPSVNLAGMGKTDVPRSMRMENSGKVGFQGSMPGEIGESHKESKSAVVKQSKKPQPTAMSASSAMKSDVKASSAAEENSAAGWAKGCSVGAVGLAMVAAAFF
ncbi:hypothetical protein H4R99_000605 [Coemansia sp. RSA 1722]|nr:hypothetical protein LPJ57_000293 [Coemansia sp. RSA 486]KAJ2238032.1 hypothetical protein IWW45_000372 [Coemansia sp. RSA 485]KAJ2603609.1 hypothetical protein GGF39_000102 [Coemansia sp. RSA 1721]KAJ2606210.1 hypothetical protein H4R99_000605 [Coemansia sp. RSA 1722]KAJ2639666.1 hypothetical protein GGF40_000632 [Coemansia sp. RSA 1286]